MNAKHIIIAVMVFMLTFTLTVTAAEQADYDIALDKLGDSQIRDTYGFLSGGGSIAAGDKDPKLIGLQKVINMFGSNLTVDGSIGEKTMEQLKALQKALALPQTDEIGLFDYEELLLRAYMAKNAESALGALGNDYALEIEYVQAVVAELQGKYFSAEQRFVAIGAYKDAVERAAGCTQPWPQSGVILRDSSYSGEDCRLIVRTSRPDGEATYLKAYMGDVLVCGLFIAGSGEQAVNLPKGTYVFKTGVGSKWYGVREAFGQNLGSVYQRLTFDGDSAKKQLKTGKQYTIVLGDATENNIEFQYEDAGSF